MCNWIEYLHTNIIHTFLFISFGMIYYVNISMIDTETKDAIS